MKVVWKNTYQKSFSGDLHRDIVDECEPHIFQGPLGVEVVGRRDEKTDLAVREQNNPSELGVKAPTLYT